MTRKLLTNILLLITVIAICILIFEVSIRFIGYYDSDSQFYISTVPIKPYVLPIRTISDNVIEYENSNNHFLIYDPHLGWTINENSTYGIHSSNNVGIRGTTTVNISKPRGHMRIALYGDSFIFGSDVADNETIDAFLRKEYTGYNVEILNFGVPGFGIDQAYLRYAFYGKDFHPDIVIIGFQAENCKRNLNVIRNLYNRQSTNFLTKPRFIMQDNSLTLVNYPAMHYSDLIQEMQNFNESELGNFEHYYKSAEFNTNSLYSKSKSLCLINSLTSMYHNSDRIIYGEQSEPMQICTMIIDKFVSDAEAQVFILHLPRRENLIEASVTQKIVYQETLDYLSSKYFLIDPIDSLLNTSKGYGLDYVIEHHYTANGNKIIADEISKVLALSIHIYNLSSGHGQSSGLFQQYEILDTP